MLETGKISALQLGMVIYPVLMSTAMLAGPNVMAIEAKSDLWISPFWASLVGFFSVYIADKLYKKFPQKNIIEQSELVLGKIIGKLIGFLYFWFLLQMTGFIVREYADFIALFLVNTPLSLIATVLVIVCALAVSGGIEVVVRSAQFFFPFFVIPLATMILLVLPDMEPQNIFPILGNGVWPSVKGSITPQGWFSEAFLMSFLLPFLHEQNKGRRIGMITVGFVLISMVVVNLVTYFLMGDATSRIIFPIMDTARYISIADFFENLESGVMAIWVIGAYVKVSLFYYAAVVGAAQSLNLSSYRPLVLPVGFLIVIFTFWGMPTYSTLGELALVVVPVLLLIFFCLIPAAVFLLSFLKKNSSASKGVRSG